MTNTVTFNGGTKEITLDSIGSYDIEDIYSSWKEWVRLSANAGYLKAFDTTGGDSVGGSQEIAPYFFCRNDLGWRIKMPSSNGEIILSGNLFPRNSAIGLFEQTTGFDAFLRMEVSTRAVVIRPEEGSLTAAQNAKLNLIPALL